MPKPFLVPDTPHSSVVLRSWAAITLTHYCLLCILIPCYFTASYQLHGIFSSFTATSKCREMWVSALLCVLGTRPDISAAWSAQNFSISSKYMYMYFRASVNCKGCNSTFHEGEEFRLVVTNTKKLLPVSWNGIMWLNKSTNSLPS